MFAQAQRPFIITIDTELPGASCNNCFDIPTSSLFTYNYNVDWGDGNNSQNVTGDISHTYGAPGSYQIEISGVFPWVRFNFVGDGDKLRSIDQWGDIVWESMSRSFAGCANLEVLASDSPDLTQVDNMSFMFARTDMFNQNIGAWDVSSVSNMSFMFLNATAFNQNISSWNVSNVTNMSRMFSFATAFNQNIGVWDVSNVTDMSLMFNSAESFNRDLSNWVVSSVTDMSRMFQNATSFNQDISDWDVAGVTDFTAFLDNSALGVTNYDRLLLSLANQSVQPSINFGVKELEYCTGEDARQFLMDNFSWTFVDDGQVPSNINTLLGGTAHWYQSTVNWSEREFPHCCNPVIIPSNNSNSILPGDIGFGQTLEVSQGAGLEVRNGAGLEIKGN